MKKHMENEMGATRFTLFITRPLLVKNPRENSMEMETTPTGFRLGLRVPSVIRVESWIFGDGAT